MSYKLTYFDAKGRGESIRLILAAVGVKVLSTKNGIQNKIYHALCYL
jgi:hypothetical protein